MHRPAATLVLLTLLAVGSLAQTTQTEPTPAPTASTGASTAATTVAPVITTQPVPVADQVAQLPLDLAAEPCDAASCALGQMLADGLRTLVNRARGAEKWSDAVRCVVLPASTFAADAKLAAGPVTAAQLNAVLATPEDPVCRLVLGAEALGSALREMLNASRGFPQVAGLWLQFDTTGEGNLTVWVETAELARQVLPQDGNTVVAMPCSYVTGTLKITAPEETGVKLKDGLALHLSSNKADMLVPPVVEARVRPYLAFPSQADLCEDWTAMAVAYTLLVLGALIMVGYQGYQFWRFRSTLSYVR